jgi:RecA-family ATPase
MGRPLPRNEIALLAGIGGYGKSTLVRQLAMAVARGDEEFLSRPIHPQHKRVIYISCEDGKYKTARILKKYGGMASPGLVFLWMSQYSQNEVLEALKRQVALAPVDLIVIDSLGNLFGGDQNNNSDAQEFYSKFARLSEESVVLFLHHIRKGDHKNQPDQSGIQGAGAFVQRARAVLMLTGEKHSTERYLHMEKENDISDMFKYEALVLDFDREQKRYSSTGQTKSVQNLRTPASADSREIDFKRLFQDGEEELSTHELVLRIKAEHGVCDRTAKERIRSGLVSARYGYYSRPAEQ